MLSGAAAELGADTRDRYERASFPEERDDDEDSSHVEVDDSSSASSSYEGGPGLPVRGSFTLSALVAFDRLRGTAGGRIVHQDGLGWGASLEAIMSEAPGEQPHRLGFGIFVAYGGASLLDGYRPPGARFTSDLSLHFVEADFGPRWTSLVGGFELHYGVSLGMSFIAASERFSDGKVLDELLVAGARLRPHAGIVSPGGGVLGRSFIDLGLVSFLGYVTPHLDEYDSLIAGLGAAMLTPYVRAGHLIGLSDDVMVGLNYQFEFIGGFVEPVSLAHKIVLTLRLEAGP